jgi:hypothetical protein
MGFDQFGYSLVAVGNVTQLVLDKWISYGLRNLPYFLCPVAPIALVQQCPTWYHSPLPS